MTKGDLEYIEGLPYPTNFSCVDIIIREHNQLVLITKANSDKLHLVGGFVDPTDLTVRIAANREVFEEVGYENAKCLPEIRSCNDPLEFIINDTGRYGHSSKHSIRSRVFRITVPEDCGLVAGDDATGLVRVPFEQFLDLKWATKNVAQSHLAIIMYYLGKYELI